MCGEWYVHGYPPIFAPKSRDYDQPIPGRHGEYPFESDFEPRTFTLRLVSPWTTDKETYRHQLFTMFPLTVQDLVFEGLHHYVILDGQIEFNEYAHHLDAQIPLRMCDPYAYSEEKSSTEVINNEGNIEVYPIFEITGEVTNPFVIVGDDVLTWSGIVDSGETLVIDCDKKTVKKGTVNCLKNYTGGFPSCPIGETEFTGTNVTAKWRNRYL
jgi:phage-related protein